MANTALVIETPARERETDAVPVCASSAPSTWELSPDQARRLGDLLAAPPKPSQTLINAIKRLG